MTEQAKKLVPEKRFPEFKDAKGWELSQFSEVYNLHTTNSYSRDMLNYENGSVKNIHYGDIHTKFQTLFDITKETVPFVNPSESLEKIKPESYCVEGDMIFADASEDLADVGKSIEIVNLNNEPLLSGLHTLLARQKDNKLAIGFGGHLFKSAVIRKQIQKESQGAKVLGISGGRLSGIKVYYPSEKQEQQKVADCLSSLDDLITAQNQKVEALKQHKKGLMQQLFPTEGKTVPKLRFPEFENDGEWQEKTIGQVAIYENGKAHEQDISEDGSYIVVNSKFISTDGEVKKYTNEANCLAKKNDILMVLSDVPNGRAIAKCFVVDEDNKYTVNQRICKLTPTQVNRKFLFYLVNRNEYFLSFDDGVKQTNLRNDDVLNCPLLLPDNPIEQDRVANCLSLLDETIDIQFKKIELLKDHKKSLMQNLFPSESNLETL